MSDETLKKRFQNNPGGVPDTHPEMDKNIKWQFPQFLHCSTDTDPRPDGGGKKYNRQIISFCHQSEGAP